MSNPPIDDFPVLSNEDVKLLYRIVDLAESSQDPPFRSLFAAYDQVLAEYGIEADHDRIYFRFLLRMGQAKTEGDGLFKRFETLLWKHGIEIDFGEDGSDADPDEPLQSIERTESATNTLQTNSLQQIAPKPSRRSSISSIHEASSSKAPVISRDFLSGISRSHSFDDVTSLQQTGKSGNKAGILQYTKPQHRLRKRRVSFSEAKEERPVSANKPTPDDDTIEDSVADLGEPSKTDPLIQEGKHAHRHNDNMIAVPVPSRVLSEIDMNAMAKELRYLHFARYAVKLFRQWRISTERKRLQRTQMEGMARQFNADYLFDQVFNKMREGLVKSQRGRETEKFYFQLEERASKARDLFLLTKAFTHWAQCASDEVLRTSAARRHILRTRYFHAWRDITVVNELKVRRQTFKKFFGIWRQRTYQVAALLDEAISFRESSLVSNRWHRWFWNFCEHRAPGWYEGKLRRKVFNKWLELARRALVQNQLSNDFQRLLTLRRGYANWIVRSNVIQYNIVEADLFRRRTLLAPSVESMRKELGLSPTRDQVKRGVDSRIARAILREWISKTQMSRQAAVVNELRITRNVWTAWNDRLRSLSLSRTIDDRIILECLYKWVIASRFCLFERLRKERLKRQAFAAWKRRTEDLRQTLACVKSECHQVNDKRSLSFIIRYWSGKTRIISQSKIQAEEFRNEHISRNSFLSWSNRSRDVCNLETWAKDARFYVLTSSSIRTWRDRTSSAKKTKRREAFSYMRQKMKTATAQKLLTHWHEASNVIQDLSSQADQLYRQKLVSIGTNLFDIWREKAASTVRMTGVAHEFCRDATFQRIIHKMVEKSQSLHVMHQQAVAFRADVIDSSAAGALRKFNWQLFQIRRLHETAQSLSDRNARKHYRNMLRYWAEKATTQRHVTSPSHRRRLSSPPPNDADDNEGARLGHSVRGALFEDTVERHSVSATPGYLATPSRRTGRGRSRLQAPVTPATTQFTPFLSRLRGYDSVDYNRSTRGDFAGRLRVQSAADIDDIPESSPIRGD